MNRDKPIAGNSDSDTDREDLPLEEETPDAVEPPKEEDQAASVDDATLRAPQAGSGEYVVLDGDGISRIATIHGFFWRTVWEYAANAALRASRRDPNVLLPGDRVALPTKQGKNESGVTEMRHRFVRRGVPAELRLRFIENDRPRANEPYILEIDGQLSTGHTDEAGGLCAPIPPAAQNGRLILGEGEQAVEYSLQLGHLNPVDDLSGVQQRLNNLGYAAGEANGHMTPQTEDALRSFQSACGLAVTGRPDEATRRRLEQDHGY